MSFGLGALLGAVVANLEWLVAFSSNSSIVVPLNDYSMLIQAPYLDALWIVAVVLRQAPGQAVT